VLHHETSSAGATVDTGGSATTSIPWLADGRVMFFDNTTSPRNIYRFSGQLPDDSLQPAAPMFLRATAGSGSVTLTWDKILGATSYNVYYATQPGLTKANYLSLGAAKVTGIVSSTHTVNGLDSNAAYYFIVTSVDENGEGPESRQASTVLFGSPTWTPVGSLSSVEILTVAADRIVGNNAYASGGNNTYATTNGGLTWTQLGGGIAGINVHSLGAHGNSVFATSQPGSVYRSTDAGGSWTNVASGTSGSFQQAIAIDPSFPTTILAGDIELSSYGGLGIDSRVIRSDDNGATWCRIRWRSTRVELRRFFSAATELRTSPRVLRAVRDGSIAGFQRMAHRPGMSTPSRWIRRIRRRSMPAHRAHLADRLPAFGSPPMAVRHGRSSSRAFPPRRGCTPL
jgi:hypothetical protein